MVYVVLHHEDDTDPPIPCNKVQVYKTGYHVHNRCTEAGYYGKVKVHKTELVSTVSTDVQNQLSHHRRGVQNCTGVQNTKGAQKVISHLSPQTLHAGGTPGRQLLAP